MTREEYVYSADLRNRSIPVGGCEEMAQDKQQQDNPNLVGLLGAFQQETTNRITELTTSMRYICEGIDYQRAFAERMDARQDAMERKLDQYNNLRERTDMLEAVEARRAKDYVPREEFNGALRSLRAQIRVMQWIFGVGFSLNAGLMTGLILFLLNRGLA